jgi:hypothetical protein
MRPISYGSVWKRVKILRPTLYKATRRRNANIALVASVLQCKASHSLPVSAKGVLSPKPLDTFMSWCSNTKKNFTFPINISRKIWKDRIERMDEERWPRTLYIEFNLNLLIRCASLVWKCCYKCDAHLNSSTFVIRHRIFVNEYHTSNDFTASSLFALPVEMQLSLNFCSFFYTSIKIYGTSSETLREVLRNWVPPKTSMCMYVYHTTAFTAVVCPLCFLTVDI